jgi:peptidoglycan/LPS O-acetylase OafA/YrhL
MGDKISRRAAEPPSRRAAEPPSRRAAEPPSRRAAEPPKSIDFRKDINGLRAISVLIVVFFHFGVPGFDGGFVGVDAFFVISGYLMTGIILSRSLKDKFSVLDFYMARARRIIPALLILCAFLLVFGLFFLPPAEYKTMADHNAASALFLSNFTFFLNAGYFDASSQQKWLLHTWSLSVEWQFYLIYPVVLAFVWRVFRSERKVLWCLVSMLVASFTLSVAMSGDHPRFAFFLLPTRAWEMMAGGLVYMLAPRIRLSALHALLLELLGLGLLVVALASFSEGMVWPGYLAAVPVLGTMMVMFANRQQSWLTGNILFQRIGDASYSIYLWHWPVSVFLIFYGLKVGAVPVVAGILVSGLLGYLSYKLVEIPSRNWMGGMTAKQSWSAIFGAMGAVCVLSAGIWVTEGVASRVDDARYPVLAKASSDWRHPDQYCQSLGRKGEGTKCVLPGQGDTRRIIVWGDSHANQWYPRFSHAVAIGKTRPEVVFLTENGCLPVTGVNRVKPGFRCTSFTDKTLQYLQAENFDRLVIVSRWIQYFFDADGRPTPFLCFSNNNDCQDSIASDVQIARLFNKMGNDLKPLLAKGVEIRLVGPVPYSMVNYPLLKSRAVAAEHLPVMHWIYHQPQSDEFSSNIPGRHSLLSYLTALSLSLRVSLTDPAEYMCQSDRCSFVDASKRPLYKDEDHLNATTVVEGDFSWLDDVVTGR